MFDNDKRRLRMIKKPTREEKLTKYSQVYEMLGGLMKSYQKDNAFKNKISKPIFNDIENSVDLITNIGADESSLQGVLMCFSFFKSILNSVIKGGAAISNLKKHSKKDIKQNAFKDRLAALETQVNKIEKKRKNSKSG